MSLELSKEDFEHLLKLPLDKGWEGPLADAKKKAKENAKTKAQKKALEEHNDDTLSDYLAGEYVKYKDEIRPEAGDLFKAFELTPYDKVKVVILGQDPYPEAGLAHGLSFSMLTSPKGSLANIFRELKKDFEENINPELVFERPSHGNLTAWAKQGVLLINTVLSLRKTDEKKNCHKGKGWERFTDAVIDAVSQQTDRRVVFVLWGVDAKKKEKLINNKSIHHVIKSPHPKEYVTWNEEAQAKQKRIKEPCAVSGSPYIRFSGSRPFSEINDFLATHYPEEVKPGIGVIDWRIT